MPNRRENTPASAHEEGNRRLVTKTDVSTYPAKRFCAASDCTNELPEHTVKGQYCSPACYHREYYKRHRKKIAKQRAALKVKRMLSPKPTEIIPANSVPSRKQHSSAALSITNKTNGEEYSSTDILSIAEAAKRLKVCRQTIYNLEAAGILTILHLTSRLSFVRWSDLLAMFDDPNMCGKPATRRNKMPKTKHSAAERIKTEPDEWCDIKQACQRYNVSANTIHNTIFRYKIPRKRNGKTMLYSTEHLDQVRGHTEAKHLQGYITVSEASEKYHIPISTVYYKINRFGLKIIKHHSKIMFEEVTFEKCLKL